MKFTGLVYILPLVAALVLLLGSSHQDTAYFETPASRKLTEGCGINPLCYIFDFIGFLVSLVLGGGDDDETDVPTTSPTVSSSPPVTLAPSTGDPRIDVPFTYELHSEIFGYEETFDVPLYTITDLTSAPMVGESYTVQNSQGGTDTLEVLEILQDSDSIVTNPVDGTDFTEFSASDLQIISDLNIIYTGIRGSIGGTEFAGLLVTYDDENGSPVTLMVFIDDLSGPPARRSLLESFEVGSSTSLVTDEYKHHRRLTWCDNFVQDVIALFNCEDDEEVEVDQGCQDAAVATYELAKSTAEGENDEAIAVALKIFDDLKIAAQAAFITLKIRAYALALGRCLLTGGVPFVLAICIAAEIIRIELTALAIRTAAIAAATAARNLAIQNADTLLALAQQAACGVANAAMNACLSCQPKPTPAPTDPPTAAPTAPTPNPTARPSGDKEKCEDVIPFKPCSVPDTLDVCDCEGEGITPICSSDFICCQLIDGREDCNDLAA